MKILILGDASNYHRALGAALGEMGHEVTLGSDGGNWMRTGRDIDLSRREGKLGGLALYARLKMMSLRDFRGYDIVQLCGPGFVNLRPERQLELFGSLKRHNGKVFMTALGDDTEYVRACVGGLTGFPYTDWDHRRREAPQWLTPELTDYTRRIYDGLDGIVSALYEYHHAIEVTHPEIPLTYAGIPVDTRAVSPVEPSPVDGPLTMMVTCHRGRETEKGADILGQVANRMEATLPPGTLHVVRPENVPYARFIELLKQADIVMDQLYALTPATTALLAMTLGRTPVTGGSPQYYDFIGEKELRPIIHTEYPDIHKLENHLAYLAGTPEGRHELRRMQTEAHRFVARHNDSQVVAQRFLNAWEKQLK